MPEVISRELQWTPRSTLSELYREANLSLRQIAQTASENYRIAYPQVDAVVLENTTLTIWLPLEAYLIESVAVKLSSGTASVTPRIGTTTLGVSGGTPIAATTTATEYAVDDANEVAALDDVNVVVASMSVGAWLTVALKVRRLE